MTRQLLKRCQNLETTAYQTPPPSQILCYGHAKFVTSVHHISPFALWTLRLVVSVVNEQVVGNHTTWRQTRENFPYIY